MIYAITSFLFDGSSEVQTCIEKLTSPGCMPSSVRIFREQERKNQTNFGSWNI